MTPLPPQPWIDEPATQAVLSALTAAGIEARFVGGCVRDALLGEAIGDIDIATPARPEEVIAAFDKAAIKVVPTGLSHGTVTAVVPPRHFEITTLRRDVETYGRRARVAFDADWAEDAARRDFTINAIYLDPDGTIHDPVGGLADLAARRVRFVGDAASRIAEDVLRLLRYYRFEARFGPGQGDADARAACHAAVPELPRLSPERIANELFRLLQAKNPMPALRMMRADGVLPAILPEATRPDRLQSLIAIEAGLDAPPPPLAGERRGGGHADPLLRLAALIDADEAGAVRMAERLRLSNAQRDRLAGLAKPWPLDPSADPRAERRAIYELGAERYRDIALLLAAEGAVAPNRLGEMLALATTLAPPAFPLAGRDVTALGIAPGPAVGRLLSDVRRWWEDQDFAPDRAACLARLKEIAAAQP